MVRAGEDEAVTEPVVSEGLPAPAGYVDMLERVKAENQAARCRPPGW